MSIEQAQTALDSLLALKQEWTDKAELAASNLANSEANAGDALLDGAGTEEEISAALTATWVAYDIAQKTLVSLDRRIKIATGELLQAKAKALRLEIADKSAALEKHVKTTTEALEKLQTLELCLFIPVPPAAPGIAYSDDYPRYRPSRSDLMRADIAQLCDIAGALEKQAATMV